MNYDKKKRTGDDAKTFGLGRKSFSKCYKKKKTIAIYHAWCLVENTATFWEDFSQFESNGCRQVSPVTVTIYLLIYFEFSPKLYDATHVHLFSCLNLNWIVTKLMNRFSEHMQRHCHYLLYSLTYRLIGVHLLSIEILTEGFFCRLQISICLWFTKLSAHVKHSLFRIMIYILIAIIVLYNIHHSLMKLHLKWLYNYDTSYRNCQLKWGSLLGEKKTLNH